MYLHLIDIFPVLIGDLLWRGEIDMIFSCHFPCWREEGRMKILNRQGIPQTNHVMDTIGVTVYKFALGLFVCKLISLAYYKELITAARVKAACSLFFQQVLTHSAYLNC